MKLCIGLTGGIGCGKSTVASLFAKLGASIIDTDIIAHQLTQANGDAISAIRKEFGSDFIDKTGALDRTKMRKLIYSDKGAKIKLEKLLHPMILEKTVKMLAQQTGPYTLVIVPLLPESPAFQQLVQRILVVDCSPETQISRVVMRNGMTDSEVRGIIARQTSRTKRLNCANEIIYNDGDLDNLAHQVITLHNIYLK